MKNTARTALSVYMTVREQYFGKKPTKMSLDEIKTEILMTQDDIPLKEVGLITLLVTQDYENMKANEYLAKRAADNFSSNYRGNYSSPMFSRTPAHRLTA